MDTPLLLTVGESCDQLRVGRTKLYELAASGEIDIVKIGTKATRITKSSIEAYVDRLKVRAAS